MARLWAILAICSVLCVGGAQGQVHTYEHVGGHWLPDLLQAHDQGQYVAVRPIGRADTLLLWIEGTTLKQGPSRHAAQVADLVAWCYPSKYPDSRHVLPNARRLVVVRERYNGKSWISVVERGAVPELVGGVRL